MIGLSKACSIVLNNYKDLLVKSGIIETSTEYIFYLDYGDGSIYDGPPISVSKTTGTISECNIHKVDGPGFIDDSEDEFKFDSIQDLDYESDFSSTDYDDFDDIDVKEKLQNRLDELDSNDFDFDADMDNY